MSSCGRSWREPTFRAGAQVDTQVDAEGGVVVDQGPLLDGDLDLGLGVADRAQPTDAGAAQRLGGLEVVGVGERLVPGPHPVMVGDGLPVAEHPDPVQVGDYLYPPSYDGRVNRVVVGVQP